ncbi:hypothetical protein DES37_106102 [Mangrovibacter plantisponsor]|uniref:Uncharacterized protein n=1 Tax=Mangrovibacter plantisponsor TaxID=451513 RepID=A0A317PYX9_9ENTR|nr:hypothetical protein DES37_106102 [Mangrovibacter plantisponsor]
MVEKLAFLQGGNAGQLPVVFQPGPKAFGQFVVNTLELAE